MLKQLHPEVQNEPESWSIDAPDMAQRLLKGLIMI
jgi:hypothetical protein